MPSPANANDEYKNEIRDIIGRSYASLFVNDGQSGTPIIKTPGLTPVLFDAFDEEVSGVNAVTSIANNTIEPTIDGTFEINFQVSFSGTGGSVVTFEIWKDIGGTPTATPFRVVRMLGTGGDVGSCSILGAIVNLAANEQIAIYAYCDGENDDINTYETQLIMRKL